MDLTKLPVPVTRWTLWGGVGCIFIVYHAASRLRQWFRLRHVPGPRGTGWSKYWLLSRTSRGELFQDLGEVCEQYGPIARIAPNYVVCGDPHEVRRMWAPRSQFSRAPWYKGFQLDPPRDCTLSMRDDDIHAVLRTKIAPGYGGKDVEGLHDSVDAGVARFVKLIEDKYLSTASEYRVVDFGRKIQYMTLDIISEIAFGERFGFMEYDGDLHGYIKTTEDTVPLMQIFALIPWLVSLLQSPLCKAMMPSERDAIGLGPIMATAKRVVGERFADGQGKSAAVGDRNDMLGSFVRHGLTQREAESESLVQIIAGSDTTASALRTIMSHLVTSPDIFHRLQNEIDTAAAEGRVSSPITDAEARQLPLLQGVIKEGLRMWPPITGIMPRISTEDSIVCGVHIPAGTNVAWSAKAAMRNEEVFGPDSEVFRPDRWVLADEEQFRTMDKVVDLCFGTGRWGCLGRPIAMIELNKMIVELLRRFDMAAVNAERPIKNFFSGVLIQTDLQMRITKRETTS